MAIEFQTHKRKKKICFLILTSLIKCHTKYDPKYDPKYKGAKMKNLTANYTIKNLNTLIGNNELIKKVIGDPNRKGLYFQPTKNSSCIRIFSFHTYLGVSQLPLLHSQMRFNIHVLL